MDDGIQEVKFEKFILSMKKVSESYARYRETLVIPWRLQYTFFEPKILFRNIKGGYGVFGSWNEPPFEIEVQ